MTDTRSSSSFAKVSAILASAYSEVSRSITGLTLSLFGPTRLRASLTKLLGSGAKRGVGLPGGPGPSGAEEIEGGTARAGELVGPGRELARVDSRDARRELCLEGRHLVARERSRDDGVGSLEEVVD